jgi:LmbE family N-acetylglucosaminyl deacetylase
MFRSTYGTHLFQLIERRARPADRLLLERSAVVFSPHYDDETLGAGGTIIKKIRCGAAVHLVFMTDGSRSHAHAIDGTRLSAIRRAEALEAASTLGVQPSHVSFLELPETRLLHVRERAVERISEILLELRCEQVFVPSTLEPILWSSDHLVTTEAVFAALERVGQQPEIFEYLVWFWYHWPWVALRRHSDVRQLLRLSLKSRFGLAITGLNTAVHVRDALQQKLAALDQYRSQMTRLITDSTWPVLTDVAQGDFVSRFFQSSELFKTYRYHRRVH